MKELTVRSNDTCWWALQSLTHQGWTCRGWCIRPLPPHPLTSCVHGEGDFIVNKLVQPTSTFAKRYTRVKLERRDRGGERERRATFVWWYEALAEKQKRQCARKGGERDGGWREMLYKIQMVTCEDAGKNMRVQIVNKSSLSICCMRCHLLLYNV